MANRNETKLARHIGLLALTLYGVGDILGAGVYGLIGKAAGELGNAVWLGFLISAVAAGITGLTYASLGSRYPKAAGSAFILQKAFGRPLLSYLIGMAVFFSGLTSMATSSRVFAGYLHGLLPLIPYSLCIGLFIITLTLIVYRGIRESMWVNVLCTVMEVSGLLIVIVVGATYVGDVNYLEMKTLANPSGALNWGVAFSGAVLTFYSFIGFEDMLNVSEEVKEPERTLPKGLLLAVAISSLVYLAVSVVTVSVVSPERLAQSGQPLVDVVKAAAPGFPIQIFSVISLFAVANTALLNFVMASRLTYGMSKQGLLPGFLARVHRHRKTPHLAIVLIALVLVVLVIVGDISNLAKSTSVLLLLSFMLMNLALIRLKWIDKVKGQFEVPYIVPIAGAAICLLMLLSTNITQVLIAIALLTIALVSYFLLRPRAEALDGLD
ncbi:Uncharacterized amino acid permease, GabP family [uncultured Synechococcales cyanobacterium]|uniref:Uncharacterized amino acid permease, GabP family n=1 Tax=uncultured Synechococcales cyanobacterium TaxID=1936017 RepID=A0A6J4VT47_9CYAN|nr:Uncharacterized amino acid permease, GabP family [uncultured Synechococcales cyanobacterium]